MADTDLPEGTDKVVAGATDEDTGDGTRNGTGRRGSQGRRTSVARTSGGSSSQTGIMDKVRKGTDKLSYKAADKGRDLLRQGLERSSEMLGNVAKVVGDTAPGIDDSIGQDYGDFARKASDSIRGIANSLGTKDPDELIDDTRNFVRKSPAVALAGAAIVGFALARLVKAGFTSDQDREEEREGRSRD